MGDSSTKAVSKLVLGGRNCFMMAVVDMSGEREQGEIVSKVECPLRVELVLLLVCKLLVARGGRTWNVCRIFATLSVWESAENSSELSDMVKNSLSRLV